MNEAMKMESKVKCPYCGKEIECIKSEENNEDEKLHKIDNAGSLKELEKIAKE